MYRALLVVGGVVLCLTNFAQTNGIRTVIQKSHADKITALEFSKDGKYFVTGSADHTVKLWDLKTGKEIRTFKGHEGSITDVHIDDNNQLIVSAAAKNPGAELRVWNVMSGEGEKEITGGKDLTILGVMFGKVDLQWAFELRSFDLRNDGTLAWAEDNLGVKLGKVNKNKYDRILDTNWQPTVVRFSPDGRLLAAGGQSFGRKVGTTSNEVLLWKVEDPEKPISIRTKHNDISRISFNQSSNQLAVLSHSNDSTLTGARSPLSIITYQNTLEVFDLNRPQLTYTYSWNGTQSNAFAFSPDGSMAVITSKGVDNIKSTDEELEVHDLKRKSIVGRFASRESAIYSMGFSPDGRLLITNGNDVNFWRAGSWTHIREIKSEERLDNFEMFGKNIQTVRMFENRTQVYSLDLESGQYQSRILPAGKVMRSNGNSIFICIGDRIDRLDAITGAFVNTVIEKIEGWNDISDFVVSENQSFLACTNSLQNTIFVQPLNSRGNGFFLSGHRRGVSALAFSGSMLASGAKDNRILLWDLDTHMMVGELLGHNGAINCLDFNHDGTLLASGANDNFVKLWDIKKKMQIETLRGHASDVLSVDFSEGGEWLVSGSGSLDFEGESEIALWDVKKRKLLWKIAGNEGHTRKVRFVGKRICSIGNDPVVKLIDPERGQEEFIFAPLSESDFVLAAKDNYYISTKAGLQFIHFVKGLKVYAFDNFDLQYNRPDLVLQKLGSQNKSLMDAYHKVYLRRLKRSGFTEAEISDEPNLPQVTIANLDSISYVAEKNTISLQLNFEDEKFPIRFFNVWVNGVPLLGYKGKRADPPNRKAFRTRMNIPLNAGYNKIEVGCINSNGAKSTRELIEVTWGEKRLPELYLVTVCASKYANPAMNLSYSVKDGKDISQLFETDKEFSRVHLTTIFDKDVTKENFVAAKNQLLQSKPDDEVILFMAGHGVLDKNFDFHFATYDMDLNHQDDTAISFDNIENLIDSIPARKKMVLIDACHSGGIDKEEIEEKAEELARKAGRNMKVQNMEGLKNSAFRIFYGVDNTLVELMQEMFHNLGEGSGAYVISAASGNGYALESQQWNNGVFTYSILDGLKNGMADSDHNGNVTVSELKSFLFENVVKLTDNQQRPTCRKENPDLDFVVWKK